MAEVSARDLRNHTRDVLRRVEAGEEIAITLNGRPVAELRPPGHRRHWVPWRAMKKILEQHPADAGLLEDIAYMREQRVEDPYERYERARKRE